MPHYWSGLGIRVAYCDTALKQSCLVDAQNISLWFYCLGLRKGCTWGITIGMQVFADSGVRERMKVQVDLWQLGPGWALKARRTPGLKVWEIHKSCASHIFQGNQFLSAEKH